jgi:hypothetical protein
MAKGKSKIGQYDRSKLGPNTYWIDNGKYPHQSGEGATNYQHGLGAMDKQRKQRAELPDPVAKRFREQFYNSLVDDKGGESNTSASPPTAATPFI